VVGIKKKGINKMRNQDIKLKKAIQGIQKILENSKKYGMGTKQVFEKKETINSIVEPHYFYGVGAKCPICKKTKIDRIDIEFIADNGECISCDHIRGDI
jgi:Zn ribbon nucleic-acid-binding protein